MKKNESAAEDYPDEWSILHDLFHETKNPLQIIESAVNLLEKDPPPEQKKDLYRLIRENTQKVNDTLNTTGNADFKRPS